MQILTARYLTKPMDPNGSTKGMTEGAEEDYIPIGRTISTNQTPKSSQGLNH